MARSIAATFERRVSPSAEWAKRVAYFALVLLATAGVAHRYGLIETFAFLWTLALVAVLALLGLVLAIGGFARLWNHGDKAGHASLVAALLSLLILAPFSFGAWLYLQLPALIDISTDLELPPHFIKAPQFRTDQMNAIRPITAQSAQLQLQAYPDLSGRRFDVSPDRVLAALAPVIAAHGWKVRGRLPAMSLVMELSIEMETPTYVLRIPADAVIRLIGEDEATFVDMRMAMRYGTHDLGSNAYRINAFMTELAAEIERQSLQIIDIPPSDGTAPDKTE